MGTQLLTRLLRDLLRLERSIPPGDERETIKRAIKVVEQLLVDHASEEQGELLRALRGRKEEIKPLFDLPQESVDSDPQA